MGVGKVPDEAEGDHKQSYKVTMTTLRAAPSQTRLQVLGEKWDHEQGSYGTWFPQREQAPTPCAVAVKTRKRELSADKDLGPYYLREAHPAERRHKLSMGAIQTNMTEMEASSRKMEAAKRLSLLRDRMRDSRHWPSRGQYARIRDTSWLMEQTRLHYGRKKRPGYSEKFNMADRNGWSFCSLICVRLNNVFHPCKDKIHVAFLYFLDKSELHFLGI